jgi:hypothetical protein
MIGIEMHNDQFQEWALRTANLEIKRIFGEYFMQVLENPIFSENSIISIQKCFFNLFEMSIFSVSVSPQGPFRPLDSRATKPQK